MSHPVDIPGTPRYLPPEGSAARSQLMRAVRAYDKGYNADVLAPHGQRHVLGIYAALQASVEVARASAAGGPPQPKEAGQ